MLRVSICVLVLAACACGQGNVLDPDEVLRVIVFEEATGKPIEGAQVLYLHRDDRSLAESAFPDEWLRLAPDLELRLARFGRSTTTDRLGVALVPRTGLADDIAVRAGQLYAQSWGKRGKRLSGLAELRAGLVVDPSVDVRVVDRAGQPCPDVEVWLQRGESLDATWECFCAGRTGADGMCRVARVKTHALDQSLRVVLKLPGLAVPPVRIDPNAPPSDPVTFVVPASVPLRLRLIDAAGRPFGAAATVRVAAAGDERWRYGERVLLPCDRGEVVLPHVSARHRLRVEVREPFELPAVEVDLPAAGCRERVATVAMLPPGPVLVGRALDAAGRPLAGRRLEACEAYGEGLNGDGLRHFVARTDGAGRFVIYLRRSLEAERIGAIVLRSDVPGVCARLGPFLAYGPEVALGDLTFAREPLLVSGRVEARALIHKRMLRVQRRCGDAWEYCELDHFVWLDDCSFELYGRVVAAAELRLECDLLVPRGERCCTGGLETVWVPFRLGERQVKIERGR